MLNHLNFYLVYNNERGKRIATRNYLTKDEAEKVKQDILKSGLYTVEPVIYEFRY